MFKPFQPLNNDQTLINQQIVNLPNFPKLLQVAVEHFDPGSASLSFVKKFFVKIETSESRKENFQLILEFGQTRSSPPSQVPYIPNSSVFVYMHREFNTASSCQEYRTQYFFIAGQRILFCFDVELQPLNWRFDRWKVDSSGRGAQISLHTCDTINFMGPAFPKTGYHTIRITKDMIYNFQKEFTYIFPECQIAGNRSTTPEEQGEQSSGPTISSDGNEAQLIPNSATSSEGSTSSVSPAGKIWELSQNVRIYEMLSDAAFPPESTPFDHKIQTIPLLLSQFSTQGSSSFEPRRGVSSAPDHATSSRYCHKFGRPDAPGPSTLKRQSKTSPVKAKRKKNLPNGPHPLTPGTLEYNQRYAEALANHATCDANNNPFITIHTCLFSPTSEQPLPQLVRCPCNAFTLFTSYISKKRFVEGEQIPEWDAIKRENGAKFKAWNRMREILNEEFMSQIKKGYVRIDEEKHQQPGGKKKN